MPDGLKGFFELRKDKNIEDVSSEFNSLKSSGVNFGLDEKQIKHVNDYFDHLKGKALDINSLSFEDFMRQIKGIGTGAVLLWYKYEYNIFFR